MPSKKRENQGSSERSTKRLELSRYVPPRETLQKVVTREDERPRPRGPIADGSRSLTGEEPLGATGSAAQQ
jgi:hypothetical protein